MSSPLSFLYGVTFAITVHILFHKLKVILMLHKAKLTFLTPELENLPS